MSIIRQEAAAESGGRIRIKERDSSGPWSEQAECRRMAAGGLEAQQRVTELFFPTRHSGPAEVNEARAICGTCPVQTACLAYSLLNWEKFGIWGGASEKERRSIRRAMTKAIGPAPTQEMLIEWLKTRQATAHKRRLGRVA